MEIVDAECCNVTSRNFFKVRLYYVLSLMSVKSKIVTIKGSNIPEGEIKYH